MNRIKLRLRAVATVIVVILAGAAMNLISSASANAGVTCYGDYCSGKDPVVSKCNDDAYIAVARALDGASLQVRYSPTCKTNWARFVVYPLGKKCAYPGTLKAIQDTGYTQQMYTEGIICNTYSERVFWTPMIYSPVKKVKASYQSDGSFTSEEFTAWA